jgi:hypothetical protein
MGEWNDYQASGANQVSAPVDWNEFTPSEQANLYVPPTFDSVGYAAWVRRGASAPGLTFTAAAVDHHIAQIVAISGVAPDIENPILDWTWGIVAQRPASDAEVYFDIPAVNVTVADGMLGLILFMPCDPTTSLVAATPANSTPLSLASYQYSNWGTDGAVHLYTSEPSVGNTGIITCEAPVGVDWRRELVYATFVLRSSGPVDVSAAATLINYYE